MSNPSGNDSSLGDKGSQLPDTKGTQIPDPSHNEQMFESMFTDSCIFTSSKRSGMVIDICHNFVNKDDALACHNASHWAEIERMLAFRTNIRKNPPLPSTSCKRSAKVLYVFDSDEDLHFSDANASNQGIPKNQPVTITPCKPDEEIIDLCDSSDSDEDVLSSQANVFFGSSANMIRSSNTKSTKIVANNSHDKVSPSSK